MVTTPEEYDVVQILKPLPQHNLAVGARGTVVMDYTKYNGPKTEGLSPAYEVEFMDSEGGTVALATMLGTDLEVVWRKETGWLSGFGPDSR